MLTSSYSQYDWKWMFFSIIFFLVEFKVSVKSSQFKRKDEDWWDLERERMTPIINDWWQITTRTTTKRETEKKVEPKKNREILNFFKINLSWIMNKYLFKTTEFCSEKKIHPKKSSGVFFKWIEKKSKMSDVDESRW